jgi:hypothetical protein
MARGVVSTRTISGARLKPAMAARCTIASYGKDWIGIPAPFECQLEGYPMLQNVTTIRPGAFTILSPMPFQIL